MDYKDQYVIFRQSRQGKLEVVDTYGGRPHELLEYITDTYLPDSREGESYQVYDRVHLAIIRHWDVSVKKTLILMEGSEDPQRFASPVPVAGPRSRHGVANA